MKTKTHSPLGMASQRVLFATLLAVCLGPIAAAQNILPPPRNEQRPVSPPATASPAQQENGEQEGADFLRKRAEWFYKQRTFPLGFIPPNARLKALKQMDAMIETEKKMGLLPPVGAEQPVTGFPGPSTWTLIGPRPSTSASPPAGSPFNGQSNSGRVSALAVHPTDPSTVYLGGAQGGIWKTTDAGLNWTPLTDTQASLAIGSIALAPSNPSIIYVGTGEQNFVSIDPTTGGDNYYGAGILKSTDGGATWIQLPGPFVGPFSNLIGGSRIHTIAVHPTNPNIVLAGVVFASEAGANAGVYRSTDGGTNWAQILSASGAVATEVLFDPTNGSIAYAALGGNGGSPANGVYKSTDGGVTFVKLAGGLPTAGVGRIELAIAASAPNTLYASIASSATVSSRLLGLFKTNDGGNTWVQLTAAPDYCAPQCFYSHEIAVSPIDSNVVFAGGSGTITFFGDVLALFRSLDGGANWTEVHLGASGTRLHVDQHAFRFSSTGTRLYVGNDGGAWRTDNPTAPVGFDWVNLNSTLAITQFYPGHAVHPSDENIGFGGTQDNGSQRYTGSLTWEIITCGDGAWSAIDLLIPSTVYIGCTSGNFPYLRKSLLNGAAGTFFGIGTGIDFADRTEFIPPIAIDERKPRILYTGTFRVYQSNDGGDSWTAISPDLTVDRLSTIATITVAPNDSNTVYATTDDAQIQRTSNAGAGVGAIWTNLTRPELPRRFVTRIAVDPTNRDIAYAAYSGFSFGADTKGHVFKTINGGASWTDISGNLPNIPVNDIVVDPDAAGTLYAATDIGVLQTANGGATWTTLGTGLPRVAVFSLKLRRQSRILRAVTHGRSVWILQLNNVPVPPGPFLSSISPASTLAGSAAFTMTLDGGNFTSGSQVLWNGSTTGVTSIFASSNQLTATISASLLTQAGIANVSVTDTLGTSGSLRFAVPSPAPTLTSLSPTSAVAGGLGFALTLNGANFNCSGGSTNSVVLFTAPPPSASGGIPHTPATCSSTRMTVNIAASEIATVGNGNVRVFTPLPGGGNSATLRFPVIPPGPTNDDFDNAINAAPVPFTDNENTSLATTIDFTDPSPSCTTGSAFFVGRLHTIWYKFTPPVSGRITADTSGSNYDTVLVAVTGSKGALTEVACNDDIGPFDFTSRVSFPATAGVTYFFMVAGFDFSSSSGNAVFHLNLSPAPPNDKFDNAINAAPVPFNVPFTDNKDSSGATTEATDPSPSCAAGSRFNTIWYKFTPPVSGRITADTSGSNYDTVLVAVTGSKGAFTEVACNDDIGAFDLTSRVSFPATAGVTYFFMVAGFFETEFGNTSFHLDCPGCAPAGGDYDGDGKTDIAVWRPSVGTWFILPSGQPGTVTIQQWGTSGDIPVRGDYDGDGKTDIAVFRPSNGTWFILPSSKPGTAITQQWGATGDIPVPGDYDGDGKTDFAVWRPSSGTWFILPSSKPGTVITQLLGASGDIPVPGDYDGDGKADFAVFRPSTGQWFIIPSSKPGTVITQLLGASGDIPVPGDYDGDGKTDIAVWRPSIGTWFIIQSSNPGTPNLQQWGESGDIPVPGDYDGDRKTDIAVWRPSIGTWFIIRSSAPTTPTSTQWGVSSDVPVQKPIGLAIPAGGTT